MKPRLTFVLAHPALIAVLFGSMVMTGLAQPVQRITGTVVDKSTRQPLPGATIFIRLSSTDSGTVGATSDADGHFILEKVPVGRHNLTCTFIGYEPWVSSYLELTSGKVLVVSIE